MSSKPWRIAVTGAAGFVGSVFLRHAAELDVPGIEVVPLLDAGLRDIREISQVSEAIAAIRPDVLLHLAAVAAPAAARADPTAAWQVNVIGTLNLAQTIQNQGSHTRFLFVGSSEAYGDSFLTYEGPIPETAALHPRNTYGATKAAADLLIGQMATDGLNAIRFRPFNHSGPGQSTEYVLPAFAEQVARIEKGQQPPILNVGNLDAERDFLDVRDVVRAYFQAALPDIEIPSGSIFNIATSRPIRISQILDILLAQARTEIEIRIDDRKFRSNHIPKASGSINHALKMIAWNPQISLEDTVIDVLNYWRAKP